jgi:hypothetical protein
MKWRLIKSAPKEDGVLHVRGVWVHSATTGDRLYFDACAGYLEDGEFVAADGEDHCWQADDFTHWTPLPPAPEAAQ